MTRYSVFVNFELLTAVRLRGNAGKQVVEFLRSLETDPYRPGDYQDFDETGRPVEVKLVGAIAIFYWADHAVKEVKIVDLRPADAK